MPITRMGFGARQDAPIIVRGDGCYLEDANGKRYLDALAGLFSINIGYTTDPGAETEQELTQFLLDDLEQAILAIGLETVCLVHMEPVQNACGFRPAAGYWKGVRAICDEYDALLSADEVITGFGRFGHWFGSERYDIRPDIVTCAKGLSSSCGPIDSSAARTTAGDPVIQISPQLVAGGGDGRDRRHPR
jgi:adenosylmethionine-8-amino-7-oxononanoate aminotransferase